MQIYDGAYNIVAGNIQAVEKVFGYMKETYLCDVKNVHRLFVY